MKYLEINNYKFQYLIEGNGRDALVIGSALYYSRSFAQSLRNSLRLHFIDYRGFAEPLASAHREEPSFEELVEDIECMRKHFSLKKCIIIGHSAHALLALEYAKKYPQHVSQLVMIGISPSLSPEYAEMAQRNWDESVWPERKAAFAERMREFPDEELAKLSPSQAFVKWNTRRVPQSWFDFHFDSSPIWKDVLPNMHILDFFYRKALSDIDITKGLEVFSLPVFLALGRFDFIIAPASCWDSIRPKFQNLTVKIFERSAHSPQYEEPEVFNAELLNWLEKNG